MRHMRTRLSSMYKKQPSERVGDRDREWTDIPGQ